ncbi:MAG: capsular biosynthesis protein, partial [Actinobacteria bacterium]|nr:capsular biosynthesis protein [Actinomycetota bacterium]
LLLKLWGKPIDLIERFIHKAQHSSNKKTSYYTNPDLSCPYIFVALHYQPECTTSPMGGMFVYQDLMLDILMKAIPEHIKIYVKAHPREGLGPILRERLRLDKRTLLIDPNLNSHRMIINSIAVATVTGTSGWEAFLSNKSVLMFGEYFYQDAPGVYKIKNLIDASNAIHDILNKSEEISDAMIMAFLMAVQDKTFPGWVDNRYAPISGISNQENAVSIANHIVDEIMTSA